MYVFITPKQARDLAEGHGADDEVLDAVRTAARERREHLQRRQAHEWRRESRKFKERSRSIHPVTTTW